MYTRCAAWASAGTARWRITGQADGVTASGQALEMWALLVRRHRGQRSCAHLALFEPRVQRTWNRNHAVGGEHAGNRWAAVKPAAFNR